MTIPGMQDAVIISRTAKHIDVGRPYAAPTPAAAPPTLSADFFSLARRLLRCFCRLFCAVLCTIVVHSDTRALAHTHTHTYEQFTVFAGHAVSEIEEVWQQIARTGVFRTGRNLED